MLCHVSRWLKVGFRYDLRPAEPAPLQRCGAGLAATRLAALRWLAPLTS